MKKASVTLTPNPDATGRGNRNFRLPNRTAGSAAVAMAAPNKKGISTGKRYRNPSQTASKIPSIQITFRTMLLCIAHSS